MIQISNLSRHVTGNGRSLPILNGVSLNVPEGALFTLLGPSGCGKTTTLRCVAGLERPSRGEIWLNGQPVFSSDRQIHVPTEKRSVGMVFQSYAIWPHMTVLQNVMYPLDAQRIAAGEKQRRSMEALERVGLAHLAGRGATALSGGQQQRVALARALVARPQVLLFDEPLSNLDAKLREQLRSEIVALQQEFGITALYVTHDQQEALAMSNRIAIMKDGEILETGEPYTLYTRPSSRFAASFLGAANYIDGKLGHVAADTVQVDTALGPFLAMNPHQLPAGSACHVFFRPESVRLQGGDGEASTNRMAMSVASQAFLGDFLDVRFARGDQRVRAKLSAQHRGCLASEASLCVDPGACIALPFEQVTQAEEKTLSLAGQD